MRMELTLRVTWLVHTCDMTRSYVWHDSFISVTWLFHRCDMTHSVIALAIWNAYGADFTCDMTRSYVWHDSFIRVTWLVHTCGMTHSVISLAMKCVWSWLYDSFCTFISSIRIFECIWSWLLKRCTYVWHDAFLCVTWLIPMCGMTHSTNSSAIYNEYEADFWKYIPDNTTRDVLLKSQNELMI